MRRSIIVVIVLVIAIMLIACEYDKSDVFSIYEDSCQHMASATSMTIDKTVTGKVLDGKAHKLKDRVKVVNQDGDIAFEAVQRDRELQITDNTAVFYQGVIYYSSTLDGQTIRYKYRTGKTTALRMFNIDTARGTELNANDFESTELKKESNRRVCIFEAKKECAKTILEENLTDSDAIARVYPSLDEKSAALFNHANVDLTIKIVINEDGYITNQKWIADIEYNKKKSEKVHYVMSIKVKDINKQMTIDSPEPDDYEGNDE